MRRLVILGLGLLLCGVAASATTDRMSRPTSSLDAGYRDMYNLQFGEAHQAFRAWQQQHPDDPLGPVSDAAAYLFSEFARLHVLESQFLTNDRNFETSNELPSDPVVRRDFDAQLALAQQLADAALRRNPRDSDALFASLLVRALRGDYLALIEKRNTAGLSYIKEARTLAEKLLAMNPTYYDAYLAIGAENYILSQRSAPVRWVLRLGGARTDKEVGLHNLQITAEKGHYLMPYARLLLAVAALRDQDRERARALLDQLAREFPRNPLYAKELAQLR